MSRTIKKGATDQSIYVEILDSASTTGGRKTGIVYNAAGLTAYYVRNGGSATSITLATLAAANSAHSDGGFKEVDATNMPGVYRLDLPDAAVASGAESVVVTVKGASGAAQVSSEIQLTDNTSKDVYDRIGAPAGASVSADIAALDTNLSYAIDQIDNAVLTDTATILSRMGTPSDLGGGATLSANLVVIEGQTDDIGAAGAGLTAIPWNASWDAEVQSEVADALGVYDPPTKAELDTAVANVSVDEIQASALADLFNTDSGTTYASAVAGSVVKEIADNAGGSALTASAIADEVQTRTIAAVTTVTNLTNAPTNGDLTATMKTSVTTAATAATPTAAAVTGAVGSVAGNVGGNVAGSVGSVTAGVTVTSNNDKTGYRLSSTGVDDILDEAVEGSRTVRQYLRGMAAALLAKLSGAETTTVVIRDVDDTKDRVTATVDADGNRSAVTIDLS